MGSLFTGKGDDGTTGLYYGGRVRKDAEAPEAFGAVDEAQAVLGLARAECPPGGEVDVILVGLERDLYVLMGELATAPANRSKLAAGSTLVTPEMVTRLEASLETLADRFPAPGGFVIPGGSRLAALLDLGRAVVRRAERRSVAVAAPGSWVLPYLNRLSSLLWAMARWQEETALPAKVGPPGSGPAGAPL